MLKAFVINTSACGMSCVIAAAVSNITQAGLSVSKFTLSRHRMQHPCHVRFDFRYTTEQYYSHSRVLVCCFVGVCCMVKVAPLALQQ